VSPRSGRPWLFRGTLLLALAAVLLWAWLARQRKPGPSTDDLLGPGDSFGEPTRLVFLQDRDSVVVVRRGETYWVVYPIADRANELRLAQTGRTLRKLRAKRVLPDTSGAVYGLSPPRARIEAVGKNGVRWGLALGDSSPVQKQIYARLDGAGQPIVLLDHFDVQRDFLPSLTELRSPVVLPLPSPLVDSISVVTPEYRLRAYRVSREKWIAREPAGLKLDPLPINRAIGYLRQPQIHEFLDDSTGSLHSMGLDPPRATWIVCQAGRCDSVRFGNPTGPGQTVYCIPAERERPVLLAYGFYRDFVDGWPRLADLRLLSLDPDSVLSVDFLRGGEGGGYRKADSGWVREPGDLTVSGRRGLKRDLENLTKLRWRSYPVREAAPPGDPDERLELRLATASRAETLVLAEAEADTLAWTTSSWRRRWGKAAAADYRVWRYRSEHPKM
jgi:hypothetical protein